MNTFYSDFKKLQVKRGDVTKTGNPLWVFIKRRKIQGVNDPRRTIATPCTHNSFNIRVVYHLLKVRDPFQVRTSEVAMCVAVKIWTHDHFDSPGCENFA